ncbi:MAG: nuclear transport factor 2 family protein [Steroidobacteraceae bacterium]
MLTIADRLEIQDLVASLAWSLDTAEVEAFVDCFASDGELVWDAFESPLRWSGSNALRQFIEGLRDLPDSAGRQHVVTNLRIRGHEHGAVATAYVLVTLRQPDGGVRTIVAGHYEDLLCVESASWRFRRHVIRDWAGPVLAGFAGQTGERVARPLPQPLEALARTVTPHPKR